MSKHSIQEYIRKPLGGSVLVKGVFCFFVGLILVGIGIAIGSTYEAPENNHEKTEKARLEARDLKKEALVNRLLLNGPKPVAHDVEGGSHKEVAEHEGANEEKKESNIETRLWANFLVMFLFILSVGAGSLFLVGLEYLVGAKWSTPLRRVTEILSFLIFPAMILGIVIYLGGMESLYSTWLHPNNDPELVGKAGFLNKGAFLTRFIIVFLFFGFFWYFFTNNSKKQDTTRDQKYTRLSGKWAPVFIIGFAFIITMVAIDWIMTLSPKWFSTMFGVAYFGGTITAALAANVFTTVNLKENGYLHPQMKNDTFYSLSGLMFGFNCFWAYVSFCQFMLIWYSNLPEETFWFLLRWDGTWLWYTICMIAFHFVIPFMLLVSRSAKTNLGRLKVMSVWLMVAHYVDLYWQVTPTFTNSPFIGLIEVGFLIISLGLIVIVFAVRAKNVNHVPVGDPKLEIGLGFRLH